MPPISQSTTTNLNETNLDNVLVITKNDLDRITNHLNQRQVEEDERVDEITRKRELRDKSQALTRNWDNTIEVRSIFDIYLY